MEEAGRPREGAHTTQQSTGAGGRWAPRQPPGPRRDGSLRYLLDLDVDLAESLDVHTRLSARRMVTAVIFGADAGQLELASWLARAASGPGVMVLDGVLSVNVRVGDRIASELLGAGDLIDPVAARDDELLACSTRWRGLVDTRFAVLDGAFATRIAPWPQLGQALLRRAERRTHSLNVQRAIACQPRLEVRLALLLWHLAARWGRVEPGGIRLTLPLTHQLLGHLIGAERPSVSHALARLARSGLVTGHGDEWHIHARVDDEFDAMLDGSPAGVATLAAAAGARGRR